MSAAVLIALEQRAGASDQDRPAWLAERKTGVTATEIAKLMLGEITDEALADLKLGRKTDPFAGNAYTAWGNEREPVIASIVQQRYDIDRESRVFHGAENARHLASPDGLGMYGFDEQLVVSEIKTVGDRYDLVPWGADFAAKGYGFQVQWNLHVLGAERCLFSWELRHGAPGSFRAGELRHEWIHRDDAVIAKLIARADRFLAVLDARAAEPWDGPAEPEPIDEELDTHAVNYLRFLQEEKDAGEAKKREWDALLAAKRSQVSAMARVTYTVPEVEVEVVDFDAARAAGPESFAAHEAAERAYAAAVAEAEEIFAKAKAIAAAAAAPAEQQWLEHCERFKSTQTVEGKPNLRVTAVRTKEMKDA